VVQRSEKGGIVRVRVKVRVERDIVSKLGVCLVVFLISYGLWFAGWLGSACLEGTSCLGVLQKCISWLSAMHLQCTVFTDRV